MEKALIVLYLFNVGSYITSIMPILRDVYDCVSLLGQPNQDVRQIVTYVWPSARDSAGLDLHIKRSLWSPGV